MGWVSRLHGKTVGLDTVPLIFPQFPIRLLASRYPSENRWISYCTNTHEPRYCAGFAWIQKGSFFPRKGGDSECLS